MTYAIICDARKGFSKGIEYLALVDRAKTKSLWRTSDDASIVMQFRKKEAAEFSLKRLKMNNPKVVIYKEAVDIVNQQEEATSDIECAEELGWDAHKH